MRHGLGIVTAALVLAAIADRGMAQMAPAERAFIRGVADYQVFPRDKIDKGTIPFLVSEDGEYVAEVIREEDQATVVTRKWEVRRQVSTLAPTKFEAEGGLVRTSSSTLTIDDVPIGPTSGSYALRFTHGDQVVNFKGILVGEIWIVGGGSNAFGAPGKPQPISPNIHMFREGKWQPAKEPFFTWRDPQTLEPMPESQGPISPWLAAAQYYFVKTGIPVGVMGIAFQDRPISQFWYESGDKRSTGKAINLTGFDKLVSSQGRGASVFCWYQGEADATPVGWQLYGEHLKAVVATIRRYAQNPKMLAAIVQLSYREALGGAQPTPYFGRIRDLQRRFCLEDPHAVLVSTLTYSHRDESIHVLDLLNSQGVTDLARGLGQALCEIEDRGQIVWQGPKPKSAHFTDSLRRTIRVTFESQEPISVMRGAETHWFVEDDDHLGYTEMLPPYFANGAFVMQVAGAQAVSAEVDPKTSLVQVKVQKEGFVPIMRVDRIGQFGVQLSLAMSALPGAKVSYGLMDDCRGSLKSDDNKPGAAFLYFPVEETQTPAAAGAATPTPQTTP